MKTFIPFDIRKSQGDDQIVYGIASTAIVDDQPGEWEGQGYEGDVVDPEAIQEALAGYWGNIREMHGESAAGKALDILVEGDVTYLVAKVVDAGAWQKIKEQVYKGFSIGGRVLRAHLEEIGGRIVRRITKLLLTEISLVDRPANPQAAILVFKRHTGGDMGAENPTTTTEQDERNALAAVGQLVEKAAADPRKCVEMCQVLRNEKELAGDLEAAEHITAAIGHLLMAAGDAEATEEGADAEATEASDMAMGAEAAGSDMAMAAKPEVKKIGRKISGSRMAIMKQALMAYAKVLAEAGDTDAAKMLKAVGGSEGGLMDGKALLSELQKSMGASLDTVAKAVLNLNERMQRVEAQPVGGGPVQRFVGQDVRPIAKRIGAGGSAEQSQAADPNLIIRLRQLVLTEGNPNLAAQYQAQLKALTGN